MSGMRAPFPYYGGKMKFASEIWQRFGNVSVYAEPFCGSAAVLLASPRMSNREVVADTNGYIVNFWRAVRSDPEAVARYADWPTYHHDLTSRHQWLVDQSGDLGDLLRTDPDACDAKIAGWWVWGISNWIAGPFCDLSRTKPKDLIPTMGPNPGGRGINAQRESSPVLDKRPVTRHGGQGVQAIRIGQVPDGIPHQQETGGRGVQSRRTDTPFLDDPRPPIGTGERLLAWFEALAQRLARVVVLDRDWTACVQPSVLLNQGFTTAVFLDPPYKFDQRSGGLYESDAGGQSPADAAHQWALDNGERYRIAYACLAGDYEFPDGWQHVERSVPMNMDKVDQVWFSPLCINPDQSPLGRGQAMYEAALGS